MTKSNPCILYTGDNEGPAVMRLQTLIDNFNASNGWQYRCNEEDMRLELDSRGWYAGLHDNGHYLAVNIDKLQMMPHPSLYEKPGAVHPDLGGHRPQPAPVAPVAPRSTFFEWFDGVTARAAQTPVGAFMASHGYTVTHTGGGCLAWEKTSGNWSVWICENDAGLGDELGDKGLTESVFCCLLQDSEGEFQFDDGPQDSKLADVVAWADDALRTKTQPLTDEAILAELACPDCNGAALRFQVSNPDAFKAAADRGVIKFEADSDCYVHPLATRVSESGWEMPEPCTNHRDNGRGICCDCGTILNGHHRHIWASKQ
jgi:hypothetical protein